MRRRLHTFLAALILAPAVGGCVQATRHSNALIFGTNTSFGIQVGTNATQVPSVVVGYNRQEAVVVPLVANTGEAKANGNEPSRLKPCDLSNANAAALNARFPVHPCSLVGVNGKAQDSYSVLASFGAQFSGAAATGAKAEGGLAQYFATGVAAQMLATTGGASVIAVGPAATASAIEAPSTREAITALYGTDADFREGSTLGERFNAFMRAFEEKLAGTDTGSIVQKVGAFETRTNASSRISALCTSVARCVTQARAAYFLDYTNDPSKDPDRFDGELKSW